MLEIEKIEETIMSTCDEKTWLELRQMLHNMDNSGSGKVNYTQFLAATLDRKKHLQVEACKVAFNIFDLDGNGQITKEELALVLSGEVSLSADVQFSLQDAIGIEMAEIDRIVQEVDQDGDGQINFEEFMDMMSGMAQNTRRSDGRSPSKEKSLAAKIEEHNWDKEGNDATRRRLSLL